MKWVMIVESSLVDREYLGRIVDRLGYRSFQAENGEEALYLLNKSLPDTLILGEYISDKNPMDLGHAIRKDGSFTNLPIMLMTSNPDQTFQRQAREGGFNAVVQRPMSIRNFYTNLELCLSNNRRLCIRAPMNFPVNVKRGSDELDMKTYNFGEGGMYIPTTDPFPRETEMGLQFKLPGLHNEFNFKGQVAHTQNKDTDEMPAGMGLKFLDLRPAMETVLGIYMENYLVRPVAVQV